jgi:hypothetical protein
VTAPVNNRGSRLVYRGSLTQFHGLGVAAIDDCQCPGCAVLDPWASDARAWVRLTDGNVLVHVRHTSLERVTA